MSFKFFIPETSEDASIQFDHQRAQKYREIVLERVAAMLDAAIAAERQVTVQMVVPDGSHTEFALTVSTCEDAKRTGLEYARAFGRKICMQEIGVS